MAMTAISVARSLMALPRGTSSGQRGELHRALPHHAGRDVAAVDDRRGGAVEAAAVDDEGHRVAEQVEHLFRRRRGGAARGAWGPPPPPAPTVRPGPPHR